MYEGEIGIGSRVKHPEFGAGVVINVKSKTYTVVFIDKGQVEISKNFNALDVIEAVEPDTDLVSFSEVERILTQIIKRHSDLQETVPMGQKWVGGKLILQPGNTGLSSKEIPIDVFFNKIIMLRDRLRVMEQRINANDKLSEEEKINLQQYLTRIYGSLTTFNVLFKDDKDHFVGEKGSRD
ncbi:MAG: hypothetical protein U0Y08_00510 [Bacteroidia bacterium]